MDYFDKERVKELENQNSILQYRVNELQREIDVLRKLLLILGYEKTEGEQDVI